MVTTSMNKPFVFMNLGNGAWHYNYNFRESEIMNDEDRSIQSWKYETVLVWGRPTPAMVKKTVIAEKWDITEEINLQNGFERYKLGLTDDEAMSYKYIDYLKEVDRIKEMVDSDFLQYEQQLFFQPET